jgi:hypothetical protein
MRGNGIVNRLHVRGSAVQRTGIECQLIFGSCHGQSQSGQSQSGDPLRVLVSLWKPIHAVSRSSGYQFIHGVPLTRQRTGNLEVRDINSSMVSH